MIRFTWLQFRSQVAVATAGLLAVAVVLAVTGPNLVHLYDTTVVACAASHDCSDATTAFLDTDGWLQVAADFLLLFLPVIIGIFWGAPLAAREFEAGYLPPRVDSGSHAKALAGGEARMRSVGQHARHRAVQLDRHLVVEPSDQVRGERFDTLTFSARDIVPVGYAAFAFVLGFSAGLLLRRALPAMALALGGFVGARLAISSWVRPRLISPLRTTMSINGNSPLNIGLNPQGVHVVATTRGILPGDWVYSAQIVNARGHAPTAAFLDHACPFSKITYQPNIPACIAHISAKFHELVSYQPASRYWDLQWYETAIFLGLAVALGALCFLWIRRPVS